MVDKSKKTLVPIEVKWQDSISDWDFQVMERAFGRGTLVTKSATHSRPKGQAYPLGEFLQKPV